MASPGLFERLQSHMDRFTPAERAIANYILTNKDAIPYETGASVAGRLGISAVTVGRFCRTLGHRNFRDFKNSLKLEAGEAPWLAGSQLRSFLDSYRRKSNVRRSLELEIAAIVEVYQLAETREFEAIVSLLARSGHVQVLGFQTERGIAQTLAHHLQYVRDGVSLVDADSGNYADIFATRMKNRCLVLIDARRYSRQSFLVAERARDREIPLVFITDKFCDWARKFTPHVLMVPTEIELFWSSFVATSCALNLLINAVITRLGRPVEPRLEAMSSLYQKFTGHVGPSARRKKQALT